MTATHAIRVHNLSKCYRLYATPKDLLKELITGRQHHREKWALRDISFEVNKGEVVGVVGANGAGKSTLLKIIAGTLEKTSGSIDINGRIAAILELGTGFNPNYTGRQNIYMGAMCFGMTEAEITKKLPWIIEFSELEEVIDQPFHTYSSGMQSRLTFSTAISVDADILVVDEALAAGDAYFVSKCLQQIRKICESGSTVFFVSHSTYLVIELCQRAIWIDNGELKSIGNAYEVTKQYEHHVLTEMDQRHRARTQKLSSAGASADTEAAASPAGPHATNDADVAPPDTTPLPPSKDSRTIVRAPMRFTSLTAIAPDGTERYVFDVKEDIRIRVSWEGQSEHEQICTGCRIDGPRIQAVSGYTSDQDRTFLNAGRPLKGHGTFEFLIKSPSLGAGTYFVSVALFRFDTISGDHATLLSVDRALAFEIKRRGRIPRNYVCELDIGLVETPREHDRNASAPLPPGELLANHPIAST